MKGLDKSRLDRREFLKMAGIAAAGLGLAACAPATAPASTPTKAPASAAPASKAPAGAPASSDAEVTAKLYEAAKKEGEVMGYANGTAEEWEQIAAAFQKKYPGIKVNGFPGTSEAIRDKVFTEARAGRPVADLLARDVFDDLYAFLDQKVLDSYLSPELKNYDQKYYDPQGLWAIQAYFVDVIEYNTQAISKEQAPKSYADLLKPEYKGKLGLEASAVPWFAYMLRIMGKEKGLEYMRKLAEQKPRLVSGHTNLHKLVVSGEIPIAVYMYNFRPIPEKEKGAPIEWLDPAEVTPAGSLFVGVIKNAPHPNAARLLADFMLSEEGAKVVLNQGWLPVRKGIDLGTLAPVGKVEVLISNDPMIGKEVSESEKTFREIFGKP